MPPRASVSWVDPSAEECLVIRGGYLGNKTLACPVVEKDGSKTIELSKGNRDLARALGLPINDPSPHKDFDGVAYLKEQRTKAVDKKVTEFIISQENSNELVPSRIHHKLRSSLVDKCELAPMIQVDLPRLTSHDGESYVLGACSFNMRSTNRRDQNIDIEFNSTDGATDIVTWLANARNVELPLIDQKVWGNCAWGQSELEDSLPELPENFRYLKKRDAVFVQHGGRSGKMMKLGNIEFLTPQLADSLLPKVIEALEAQGGTKSDISEVEPTEPSPSPSPQQMFPMFQITPRKISTPSSEGGHGKSSEGGP